MSMVKNLGIVRWTLAACLFLLAGLAAAHGEPTASSNLIEAGASQNHFYIEPSYDGTSVTLFGAVDASQLTRDDFDIIITLRGPERSLTVWEKARRAGLWINAESFTFDAVPNFYAVLSTKPLAEIAPLAVRNPKDIGVDALEFISPQDAQAPAPRPEFRDALIKLKRASGLFVEADKAAIEFLGARLFRARVFLPPAAGAGLYRAGFYVFQDSRVAGEATAQILINKIGIEARLSSAAAHYPWLYGLLAVILAAAVGSGASLIFRRS